MNISERYMLELEYKNYMYIKIHASRDHQDHIFIKDNERFIGWIGYKGFIEGSAMTDKVYYNDKVLYKIIGVDENCLD